MADSCNPRRDLATALLASAAATASHAAEPTIDRVFE
jgi:hypothetical protein